MRVRESEYIVDILKRFKTDNNLFGLKAKLYYDFKNKCKGRDYN